MCRRAAVAAYLAGSAALMVVCASPAGAALVIALLGIPVAVLLVNPVITELEGS